MTVVSFAKAKEDRTPHWTGPCRCLGCKHEWIGVAPVGTHVVECPVCGLNKGHAIHLFGADEGDLSLQCNCGCDALNAYRRKGRFYVKCMACGEDLTHAFYEG